MNHLLICLLVSTLLNQVSVSFKVLQSKSQKSLNNNHYKFILHSSTSPTTSSNELNFDVSIVGGGIAGTSLAWLLQEQQNCKVALIDSRANSAGTWYPNYGEWRDEWHTLSERMKFPELKECTTTEWETTDCFFGGSFDIPTDERLTLPRPYVRVDRIKLQKVLRDKFAQQGGQAINGKLLAQRISPNLFDGGLVHDASGSKLTLDNGMVINSKVVVDATGLESRLTSRESSWTARGSSASYPVGFQIAYGFIAHATSLGPYNVDAMTLFDYRTSYLDDEPEWQKEAEKKPTFMYAMPLEKYSNGTFRVFMEETSLVGRGRRRLSFAECKQRAQKRLAYHGIKVLNIEEEEYCYIPMGGELPERTQRVIAFGAAANIVHPSTGYQACRMMAASTDVAAQIGQGVREGWSPDDIASRSYNAMWGKQNRQQRDFQAFGGDFLMAQPVQLLRGFFSAFFAVDQPVWSGFLGGWPGLPNNEEHAVWNKRLGFALSLFLQMPTQVKLTMVLFAIKHTFQFGPNTLLRSLGPDFLFGGSIEEPLWQAPVRTLGDDVAKTEARTMIRKFEDSKSEGLTGWEDDQFGALIQQQQTNADVASVSVAKSNVIVDEKVSVDFPAPFN